MSENLDDGEFWLPPQFLSDDDATESLLPFAAPNRRPPLPCCFNNGGGDSLLFPSEFPYGSPLESPGGGSSETESDEEEQQQQQLVAEMTRRMARSSLHSSDDNNNNMGRFVSGGSPQSTLCGGCHKGSSHGSPKSVCEMPSSRATWDLLHAAAGEMERMRLSQQECHHSHNQNGLLAPQRNPSPVSLPSKNTNTTTNPDVGFHTNQSLSHHQLKMVQRLRQQQMAKQQNAGWGVQNQNGGFHQLRQSNHMATNRGRNSDSSGRNTRPLGMAPSAWPPLQQAKPQQPNGSGMRAVFISNPSSRRRDYAGTGVFLPRRADNPSESRKKPAYSIALVPTRVAQALNLKLDDTVGGQPQHLHRFNVCSNLENAAAVVPRQRSDNVHSQQKRPQPSMNQEIMLPQEWTY
ncbi:uncharacterized protein LOC130729236 isoform X3 [Lotus japonicus]|uniref:uncharacterized protein LOC130729236 isoform X3 n=1 Tax=Lotus japonicus TaxID=34305 RepID=UPI0025895E5E|nr:uncharacterized protein LOC130729236 isoform X3 [Lotus japonicus]